MLTFNTGLILWIRKTHQKEKRKKLLKRFCPCDKPHMQIDLHVCLCAHASAHFLENGMSFFLLKLLAKSTIQPCMDYCCHVCASTPGCYLELLDKLQKRICRTVGPSLAAFLEPLAHHQNVTSLSLFFRYYLVDVHLNWLNLFHFLTLKGGLPVILIDFMIFLTPFLDVTRMFLSSHS